MEVNVYKQVTEIQVEDTPVEINVENSNTTIVTVDTPITEIGEFYKVKEVATGEGTTDHNKLTNRSMPNQHPISAITGLQAKLDDIDTKALEIKVNNLEEKIENISEYDDTEIVNKITELESKDTEIIKELSDKADKTDIPDTSEFINKDTQELTNYYSKEEVNNIIDNIPEETDPVFTNSVAHGITQEDIENWNNKSEFTGDYEDLDNKPTIPSKVSELENDKEYLTEIPDNYITEDKLNSKGYLTDVPEEYITETELSDKGYLTEFIEEDPTVPQHVKDISEYNITNWNEKVETKTLDKRVKMFHATIDNSSFQYVKGSADFTYEDVVNTENCILEVAIANEKMYLIKQEFKNINPPDPISGRYVGFSNMIRTAGEFAELFLFVYDPENLPTDEESLKRLETWGDYQYCQSSYQPVMMGNFLGKDIAAQRNRDNLAPSLKAVGDYTDSQCGVVLDYMQTTFANNIMALVGMSYTKKPEIIYDNATGFEASNDDAGDTWHLTGLNLSKYKRLKFYVKSGGDGDANYSPAHIVEMHLDDRAKGSFGYFSADHAGHCPNNRNRHHIVTFIVNAEKTAVQFQHSISIYGTAATNSSGGRACYLIEGYYD